MVYETPPIGDGDRPWAVLHRRGANPAGAGPAAGVDADKVRNRAVARRLKLPVHDRNFPCQNIDTGNLSASLPPSVMLVAIGFA